MSAIDLKDQGNRLFAARQYEDAIGCYSKAILKNPSAATYYTNRALCFIKLQKWNKAIADCQRAIEIEPKSVKGHFFLGQAHLELDNYDEAITSFKRGVLNNTTREAEKPVSRSVIKRPRPRMVTVNDVTCGSEMDTNQFVLRSQPLQTAMALHQGVDIPMLLLVGQYKECTKNTSVSVKTRSEFRTFIAYFYEKYKASKTKHGFALHDALGHGYLKKTDWRIFEVKNKIKFGNKEVRRREDICSRCTFMVWKISYYFKRYCHIGKGLLTIKDYGN